MFTMKLFKGSSLARSFQVTHRSTTAFPFSRTVIPHSPFPRSLPTTIKTAASPAYQFHSRARLPARGQPQRSGEWEQRRQEQYYRYRTAKPLFTHSLSGAIRSRYALGVAVLAIGGATVFYFTHIEMVPVSGRRRFNCFSDEAVEAQSEMAYRQIMDQEGRQGKILGRGDSRTRMVHRVMSRLIEGGDLGTGAAKGKPVSWEINVIHDDSTLNAFVLPGGKVFVYSGILRVCLNDSGLAAVLGHEIAHNLCGHAAEQMSSNLVIQSTIWVAMAAELLLTQGGSNFISQWLGCLVLDLGIRKPSSRQQESEADYVGLLLMSQSCYDPKEAVGLWQRMEQAQKGAPPEFLSTHPSNEHRVQTITDWLPEAEEARSNKGCVGIGIAGTSGYMQSYAENFKKAVLGKQKNQNENDGFLW